MSVRIVLDQSQHRCYTNLDFITGTVHLVLPNDAAISAITVKLEAESRTRLTAPKFPENERSDKKRIELELHKLLYKVVTVFPTPDFKERSTNVSGYTLLAGQYVYPFSIKFPFNNDCTNTPNALKDIKMGQVNVSFAPIITKHVKKTLPPSLTGFPGEAEIKYYVKATVVRPKFFQENLRSIIDIKFLPIEPPRPPHTHEETYARRKRQFQRYGSQPQQQKKTLFRKNSATSSAEEEPPAFQVDARLPNPAIITCNEALPLRILVEKLNNSSATAFLSMLQIELIGYTRIRAHDLERIESASWILMSHANMNMPLGNPVEKGRKEWKLPSRLWKDHPIPNTVAPTFETCNLSRRYELEIRVGLAHGLADGVRPELIVLPLKLPVEVYSGIAPPEKLLQAMANNPRPQPIPAPLFPPPSNISESSSTIYPQDMPTPTTATPLSDIKSFPPSVGHVNNQQSYQVPDDAPPSYEDAIADEIAPVDGPRRDYHLAGSDNVQQDSFNPDSKSGLNRRVSERLFASNAPSFEQHRTTSEASAMSSMPIQEDTAESPGPSVEAPSSPSRSQIWKQNLSKRLSGEKQ